MRLKSFFFLLILCRSIAGIAQTQDFCTGLQTIITDAANKFANTKGEQLVINDKAIKWASKTPISGIISARVVSSMGLFYEAALYQTKSPDSVDKIYTDFKGRLSNCLTGYTLSTSPNFNKGLEAYKKLVYMKDASANNEAPPPPHVSMEVDYYKNAGIYTIILYVWEH